MPVFVINDPKKSHLSLIGSRCNLSHSPLKNLINYSVSRLIVEKQPFNCIFSFIIENIFYQDFNHAGLKFGLN